MRTLGQRYRIYERGAIRRELTLGLCEKLLEKKIGSGEFEYGVAEKLESFIMTAGIIAMFVEVRAMRQRLDEEVEIVE